MGVTRIPREATLLWVIGFAVVVIYISPWLVYGEDSYVRIHDGLDSNIIWHTLTAREKIWFAPNGALVAPVFVGGAPRVSLPSELKLITALFAVFEPFWAYISHQFVIRLIAFSGMAFLVLEILSDKTRNRTWIAAASGIAFAIVPFWAWTGASAGIACVALACWRLWAGKGLILPFLLLAAYPFVSSIALGGMFIVGFVWLFAIWSVLARHRTLVIVTAALVLTVAQITAEYRLFLFLAYPDFASHRLEFALNNTNLRYALWAFLGDFFRDASGVKSLQYPVVLSATAFSLAWMALAVFARLFNNRNPLIEKFVLSERETRLAVWLVVALVACAAFSAFVVLWEWPGSQLVKAKIPILKPLNLARTNYLNPFAWSLVFALCMILLTGRLSRRLGLAVIGVLVGLQAIVAAQHHEFAVERDRSGITFSQFFATPLFERIATELDIDRRIAVVASIGMHPSIAQFNGFKTADAYLPLYPFTYKHRFRHMMINEFSRDPEVLSYFNGWGSRVYMFLSEVRCPRMDTSCTAEKEHFATSVQVSLRTMKNFGIDYLFSIATIGNAAEIGLVDRGTFRDPASAWAVTVYQLGAAGS